MFLRVVLWTYLYMQLVFLKQLFLNKFNTNLAWACLGLSLFQGFLGGLDLCIHSHLFFTLGMEFPPPNTGCGEGDEKIMRKT